MLDGFSLAFDVDRLVLVADQDVAGALQEDVGGLAARSGAGLDVIGDQFGDEIQAGLLVGATVALGGVGRQQVPLRRSGAQRAGRDDLDARGEQVVPVLDVLRVALAHHQGHHRPERDPLGDVGVPFRRDLAGLDQPGDVGLDREIHDVGRLAVHHAAGLVTGGAVGRGDRHALAFGGVGEGRDDLAPARLRHGIGHQGQGGVGLAVAATAGDVAGTATAAGQEGGGRRDCRGGAPAAQRGIER